MWIKGYRAGAILGILLALAFAAAVGWLIRHLYGHLL